MPASGGWSWPAHRRSTAASPELPSRETPAGTAIAVRDKQARCRALHAQPGRHERDRNGRPPVLQRLRTRPGPRRRVRRSRPTLHAWRPSSPGRPVIYGDGSQSRDFTFIDDVVSANLLAADVPNGHRADRQRRLRAATVADRPAGRRSARPRSAAGPSFEAPRPGDVRDSQADIRSPASDSGIEPRSTWPKASVGRGLVSRRRPNPYRRRRTERWTREPGAAARARIDERSRRRAAPTPRLTMVISSLVMGGAERVMTELANHWASQGWTVTIIHYSPARDAPRLPARPPGHGGSARAPSESREPRSRQSPTTSAGSASFAAPIRDSRPDVVLSFMANVMTVLATHGSGSRSSSASTGPLR